MTKEVIIDNWPKLFVSVLCVSNLLHRRIEGIHHGVDKRPRWRLLARAPFVRREPTLQVCWRSQVGVLLLDVSPSRDSHPAFFDLAAGHGLRVDGLHDVAAHVLEELPSEALISELTAIKVAV